MTHWDLIAAERNALADLLEGLTDEQLATPSLCGKWTVKDIGAHVMVGPTSRMSAFLVALVRGRGSFDAASEHLVERRRHLSRADVVAILRDHADSRFSPPTMDWHAPLTDVLVHREDIAVPLGLSSDRPVEAWQHALDFLVTKKARTGFVPGRLPELTYAATDVEWSHGSGPVVSGPAAALGTVMCGRDAVVDRLSGPGAETLAAWLRR
ncbi:MAG: maleylpyruvate isomerase family mycothiol-dependent enzyme [Actinomycetota bacterium]|nr:maleylpyruvate isomerase family mycothiol-dependent enzyme [Actinomycetota bacterium]